MPRYRSLFILVLLFSLSAAAQDSILYYDAQWQPTKKRKAEWYRTYELQDSIYKVNDFYKDGTPYMIGYRTTLESNSCKYRVGSLVFFDPNGHKTREGQYSKGIRVGTWKDYYPNSNALQYEYHYTDDTERLDYSLTFDSLTHNLTQKTIYVDSNKTLKWKYASNDSIYSEITTSDSEGVYCTITRYRDHTVVKKEVMNETKQRIRGTDINYRAPIAVNCYNEKGETIKCDTTDKKPTYSEQVPIMYNMQDYLSHNLRYPSQAKKDGVEGRVVVRFAVDEDGAVSNVRVIKGIGDGCDEEAIRAISEMPYWRPGMQNGKPVRVFITLPLTFKLK